MQIKFALTAEEYAEAQRYWQRRLAPRWTRISSGFVFLLGLILILLGALLLIGSVWSDGILCAVLGLFFVVWHGVLLNSDFDASFGDLRPCKVK